MRGIILFCVVLLLTSSCATKYLTVEKEVPVEKVVTEYKNIIQKDSIFIEKNTDTYSKGDTVYRDIYKYIYRDRLKRDTVFKTDSIEVPVHITTTEVREVKYVTKFQSFLIYSGVILWLVLIIAGLLYIKKRGGFKLWTF